MTSPLSIPSTMGPGLVRSWITVHIGCGGGPNIIAAVIQIFINHHILGMEPLAAVESPRIYHSRDLETVSYENLTVFNGKHFELSEEKKQSLIRRGHKLKAEGGAICQFVVHNITVSDDFEQLNVAFRGILTAVTDPRKGGWPEAESVGTLNEPAPVQYPFYITFLLVFYPIIIKLLRFMLSRYA